MRQVHFEGGRKTLDFQITQGHLWVLFIPESVGPSSSDRKCLYLNTAKLMNRASEKYYNFYGEPLKLRKQQWWKSVSGLMGHGVQRHWKVMLNQESSSFFLLYPETIFTLLLPPWTRDVQSAAWRHLTRFCGPGSPQTVITSSILVPFWWLLHQISPNFNGNAILLLKPFFGVLEMTI